MTAHAHGKATMPHLFSALFACAFVAAILFSGRMIAIHLEHSTLSSTAPELFPLKRQGLAFQRAAAQAEDVLPVYGSSEFFIPIPETGPFFFRTAPTGFQVSPVGRGGMKSLITLQKVGALGSHLRGKKLGISLSATWFCVPDNTPYGYEANFSLIAASELTFGTALDFKLKRAIASRMLQFPRTLAKSPLLEFALRRLASGRRLDRVLFYALWPVGEMENVILDLQDHFESLIYILRETKSGPRLHPQILDWPSLIAKASQKADVAENEEGKAWGSEKQTVPSRRDTSFCPRLNEASEWVDLELLLRALKETHAQALLLSTPMDGQFYDQIGVSRSVRECYYKKMRALAQRYNFALVGFEQHDEDRTFLNHRLPEALHPPVAHLTAKGWMFYNRVLDDFFHARRLED